MLEVYFSKLILCSLLRVNEKFKIKNQIAKTKTIYITSKLHKLNPFSLISLYIIVFENIANIDVYRNNNILII